MSNYTFLNERFHTAKECADRIVSEYVYLLDKNPMQILSECCDICMTNQIVSDWRLTVTTDDVLNAVRRFRAHLIQAN
jgi:hypothetical protein